jgi:hypothetical protein
MSISDNREILRFRCRGENGDDLPLPIWLGLRSSGRALRCQKPRTETDAGKPNKMSASLIDRRTQDLSTRAIPLSRYL